MSSRSCDFRAGAASVCITPSESLWLAGYAARTAPATGKISDLFVSALVLDDQNGERLVIASADVIAITQDIAEAVAERAQKQHGLPRRQILLGATHTHYAPEYRAAKHVFFNIPADFAAKLPEVAARLVSALVQAINEAYSELEPVRLFVRRTTAAFAHNRRRRGVVEGTPSTEDIVDHDVPVLECVDEGGRRKAIVFGYACHNTTIPWADCRYCGDWAGFACDELRAAFPGVTPIFVAGAGADQDPEPNGSLDLSMQHGREIAKAVQQSLQERGTEIAGSLNSEIDDVQLPLERVTEDSVRQMVDSDDRAKRVKGKFLQAAIQRGERLIESYSVRIQVVRFGRELLLVALSGEPVVDWAHKLKHEFEARAKPSGNDQPQTGWPNVWAAGYCNDMYGYLPTDRIQAEGGYEGGRATLWSPIPAPFAAGVEQRVTDEVHRLIGQVAGATESSRQSVS